MIKFLDLTKINKPYLNDFKHVFEEIVESGWVMLGKKLESFENEFANYCGSKYCIGVANGLDAIILILRAYKELGKLKNGDEVIVPANTYIATILGVIESGLKPILVEPKEGSFNIDVSKVHQAITTKTKAIFAVHLYGQLAEINELKIIANDFGLLLLDDAAQAHGAQLENGSMVGSLTDATAFSFYPGKNLGAIGDGGAITTNSDSLFELIRHLRNYGSNKKYFNLYKGVNSRLDEIQAAFLSLKLKNLNLDNHKRNEVAKRYLSEINNPNVQLPNCSISKDHVFHLFVIRVKEREQFIKWMFENEIETLIHYPVPPHKQVALSEFNSLHLPITEIIHKEVVSLPISNVITHSEVTKVVNTVNLFKVNI